jgi:hypothetical protein
MPLNKIPNPLIAEVASALASHLGSHSKIDALFTRCRAPGEVPVGNMIDKMSAWLRSTNEDSSLDAFVLLGCVLEEFMERPTLVSDWLTQRERVKRSLATYGLSYEQGGRIVGSLTGVPSRSVEAMIRERDLPGLEIEFTRALRSVGTDPPAAITAACSILESLCRIYIEAHALPAPRDQTLGPLWNIVRQHLGLGPSGRVSDDLRKILGGLSTVTDGIGALRTHAGSAHGRGNQTTILEPRHARLAVHAAHTVVTFVLETWSPP